MAGGGAQFAGRPAADGGGTPVVTVPRVPAREAAEEELSRPEYQQSEPGLLQQAAEWFWDRVADLFDALPGGGAGSGTGVVVVTVLVVLLLAALVLRLGPVRRSSSTPGDVFADAALDAAGHRAAAERHAADGDWDTAVLERMRALVRSLEERAVLDPRPGRTADEAAAEAGRALPEHRDGLRGAARTFDDVCYGGRHADRDAYARLRDLDAAVQDTRPRLPGTAAHDRGGPA